MSETCAAPQTLRCFVEAGVGIDVTNEPFCEELAVFGDQPPPGSLRLRLSRMGRVEAHSDGTEEARSLYFSRDLRKLA